MDITFVLSAIIFTLLAIVVATSLLGGSSDLSSARSYFGYGQGERGGGGSTGPRMNGHIPERRNNKKKEDDWCEMSGSAHDHWDVVKSEMSEEAHPYLPSAERETPVELSSSCSTTSSLSASRPGSQTMSLDVDTSSEASSGRRSFIGLSDSELLKCAFSHPQTEGATESHANNDKVDSNNSLKYVPGKARSHHLEMMMSKEELEEEQRVQREQLAAIFQLLKDNKETFGEVSDGDMEEQLKLYSI